MSNWQLQAEAQWEALNAPDPAEDQMKEAAVEIGKANDKITEALANLESAVDILDDTPMADKLYSILEDIDSLNLLLMTMKGNYERGERE